MSQSPSLKDPSALSCTPKTGQPSELPIPAHHWDPLDRHYRSHCPEASKHTFLRYYWQKIIQKRQKSSKNTKIYHKNFEAVVALRSLRSWPEIHTISAIHTQRRYFGTLQVSETCRIESQAWSWDPNVGSIWDAANFESRLWEAKCRECPIASIHSRAMENQLSLMSHWTYHEPIAIRQESHQLCDRSWFRCAKASQSECAWVSEIDI